MVLPLIPILAVAGVIAASAGVGTAAVANAEAAKANTEAIKAGGQPKKSVFDVLGDSLGFSSNPLDLVPVLAVGLGLVGLVVVLKK